MKNPILIATLIAAFAVPALADDLRLEDVRAMSDDELYALAKTLSAEDETRLYQQARKEFPDGALGLQAAKNELAKHQSELEACKAALASDKKSEARALNEKEPGRYFSLLRIAASPSDKVMDMTPNERAEQAPIFGRDTNRVIRDLRGCKRKHNKRFGSD